MDSPKRQGMAAARALLAAGGTASLGVTDVEGGGPFVTLVNVAVDDTLRPIILISALAHHAKCLAANARASLLLHAPLPDDGDPLTALRVTVGGTFQPTDDAAVREAFLARHPYAELYAGFGDFRFWRMSATEAHIIAGFGRAYGVRFQDLAEAT